MDREATGRDRGTVVGGSRERVDWLPPVDIAETDAAFLISVELCGIPREEIVIALEDGRLTVSGVRKAEADDETVQYHERPTGHFARLFSFRTPVDEEGIEARLADGVLNLSIPKKLPTKIPLG